MTNPLQKLVDELPVVLMIVDQATRQVVEVRYETGRTVAALVDLAPKAGDAKTETKGAKVRKQKA